VKESHWRIVRVGFPVLLFAGIICATIIVAFWTALENRKYSEQVARVNRAREMETRERRVELDYFLSQQCVFIKRQNDVMVGILQEANEKQFREDIAELGAITADCIASLPDLSR